MKKLQLLIYALLSVSYLSGQDLILTDENELKIVEIVRMDSNLTFYRYKGEKVMEVISNDKIKFYNWVAKNKFMNKEELYSFRKRIVTMDMSGNWVVLNKNTSSFAKELSRITAVLSGVCLIGAYTADGVVGSFGFVGMSIVCLTISAVSGIVYLAKSNKNGTKYSLRKKKNTFTFDRTVPISQKNKTRVNLGPSTSGLGFQLSF